MPEAITTTNGDGPLNAQTASPLGEKHQPLPHRLDRRTPPPAPEALTRPPSWRTPTMQDTTAR